MSRRDVRTLDPEKSIWLNLPEDIFRQHLHTLPLVVEQQVADDFASLVAVEEGAQSVAAVCIEEYPQSPRLTLRFAALDVSLNDTIQKALHEWSLILSGVASGNVLGPSDPFSDPVNTIFRGVIRLHFRRLLGRLRSIKWDKPKYLSKSHKKPLWQDIGGLIHRAQFTYTKKEKDSRLQVEETLDELAAVYEAYELTSEDELTRMEQLVVASYDFCSNPAIKEYSLRLESGMGAKPTPQVASAVKTLRQIQKISSYRRISIFLVKIATEYSALFKNGITFAYLTPYQSIPTTIGYEEWATTCHVHAEVQLAVHYDLIPEQERETFLMPRTIGISKSLCYLCYRFLEAHRGFFPSRTHGRLYDQWTLPDLPEFDDVIVRRYRGILKDIDEEVVRHTEYEPELRRLEPMTSIDVYSTYTRTRSLNAEQ